MTRATPRRGGFSLVELCLTLVLAGLVGAALVGVLRTQNRLARAHATSAALAEALRIPAVVLPAELRFLDPAADIYGLGRDTIELRAFRGTAVVCGTAGAGVLVRYRGVRVPNPEKDTVLALVPGTSEPTLDVRASRSAPGSCEPVPGASVYRWQLGGTSEPAPGTVLLLYEHGSYHLAMRAVRYRRTGAGRQPLTAERVDVGASGFFALGVDGAPAGWARADALGVRLVVRSPRAATPGRDPRRASIRLRLPFLNRRLAGPAGTGSGRGAP